MLEDKLLVLRCKRGSPDALRRVYEKYKNGLLILAVALLNDKTAAEDVLHDVFVGFVKGLPRFELNGSLRGYLATCVANRARNVNKARQQKAVNLDEVEHVSSNSCQPYESLICNEELLRLASAMAQLSYEQRETILLHTKGQLRLRAIADLQGVSVNTVKSRYRYGIDKLRSILEGAKNETRG